MSRDESSGVMRLHGVDPITFFPRLIDAFARTRFVSCDPELRIVGHGGRWTAPRGRAVAADAMILEIDGYDGEVIEWITSCATAALVDWTSYHDGSGSTRTSRRLCIAGKVVFQRDESDLDRDPDRDEPVPDARRAPLPPELLERLGSAAASLFTCDLDELEEWNPLPAWLAAHPEPQREDESDEIPF